MVASETDQMLSIGGKGPTAASVLGGTSGNDDLLMSDPLMSRNDQDEDMLQLNQPVNPNLLPDDHRLIMLNQDDN